MVIVGLVRRHDGRHIAHNEQIARLRLHQQRRIVTRVGTRDHQSLGTLPLGRQFLVNIAVPEIFILEQVKTFYKAIERHFFNFLF